MFAHRTLLEKVTVNDEKVVGIVECCDLSEEFEFSGSSLLVPLRSLDC